MKLRSLATGIEVEVVVELFGLRDGGDGYSFGVYHNTHYVDEKTLRRNYAEIDRVVRKILKSRSIILGETAKLVVLSEGVVDIVIE